MKRNRQKKRWLSRLLLTLLVIAFMATIGVRLLVNAIQLVTDLTIGRNEETPAIGEEDFFAPPDITDIPDATSSAAIKIAGTAPDNTTIYVYVNNVQKRKLLTQKGTFQTKLSLTKEENIIYVEAQNPDTGQSKSSPSYTVLLLKEGPELSIETPVDNQIVSQANVTAKGTVSKDSTISINGQPSVINASGSFTQEITLTPGENKIRILATDIAGNTKDIVLTVVYEP